MSEYQKLRGCIKCTFLSQGYIGPEIWLYPMLDTAQHSSKSGFLSWLSTGIQSKFPPTYSNLVFLLQVSSGIQSKFPLTYRNLVFLLQVLVGFRVSSSRHFDQIWPNTALGGRAPSRATLISVIGR